MSSVSTGYGVIPVNHPSGLVRQEVLPGGITSGYNTAIYQFQPVVMSTSGVLNAASATTDAIIGVFMGCQYTDSTGRPVIQPNWVANTTYATGSMYAYFTADPLITYKLKGVGSYAQTAIGDQVNLNAYTTNNSNGYSTAVGSAVVGVGVQGQFRITGLYQGVDNAWGDSYTEVLVQIAKHPYVYPQTAI